MFGPGPVPSYISQFFSVLVRSGSISFGPLIHVPVWKYNTHVLGSQPGTQLGQVRDQKNRALVRIDPRSPEL